MSQVNTMINTLKVFLNPKKEEKKREKKTEKGKRKETDSDLLISKTNQMNSRFSTFTKQK